jgi:hypothetical protein
MSRKIDRKIWECLPRTFECRAVYSCLFRVEIVHRRVKPQKQHYKKVILFFQNPADPKVQFDASTYKSCFGTILGFNDYG